MRVSAVLLIAAFAITEASASSIVTLEPSAGTPSITALADSSVVPSIEAVADLTGPAPSMVALADTPTSETPDVISLGGPMPAGEIEAAKSSRPATPMVIRGGEVGSAYARPSPAQASAPSTEPLLDPNDRGTPAKRKALKRQEERLARERTVGQQSAEPDPSTAPAPLGR